MPVHKCAMAYVKGRSISDNASAHKDSRHLLKMDFTNFFPSIKFDDVVRLISDCKEFLSIVTDGDAEIIAKAVCYKGALTIGAPSSPTISNAMLYSFDVHIQEYCDQKNLRYTRYADDIAISSVGHGQLLPTIEIVRYCLGSLQYQNIQIHEDKNFIVS